MLTTDELIGYRARALAKHRLHMEMMRAHVTKSKRDAVLRYEKQHAAKFKNYDFKPGRLVLVRNTEVENSLDRKMKPRYFGPMIVIRRAKGGSYLVAEMDGALYHKKIAQFRVVPYHARHSITLPDNIAELVDISERTLRELENAVEDDEDISARDISFEGVNLHADDEVRHESEEEVRS